MNKLNNKKIVSIAEYRNGAVNPVTYEVAAFGHKVAQAFDSEFNVLILGENIKPSAEEIANNTGCSTIGIESNALTNYLAAHYQIIIKLEHEYSQKFDFIFIPHTPTGWDFAPGLAEYLGASCITGVAGFKWVDEIVFFRSLCNGKMVEEIAPEPDKPCVITVMPGVEEPVKLERKSAPEIKIKEYLNMNFMFDSIALGESAVCRDSVDLGHAEVIISAGRGIKKPEALAIIEELVAQFDKAAIGASRPVCDNGWLDICHQVGMTGQTVRPKLYIACGISGAVQHTVGMKRAELIIAINTDKHAPICRTAHYCVVADLHEFIPVLIEKIKEFKSRQHTEDRGQS